MNSGADPNLATFVVRPRRDVPHTKMLVKAATVEIEALGSEFETALK